MGDDACVTLKGLRERYRFAVDMAAEADTARMVAWLALAAELRAALGDAGVIARVEAS